VVVGRGAWGRGPREGAGDGPQNSCAAATPWFWLGRAAELYLYYIENLKILGKGWKSINSTVIWGHNINSLGRYGYGPINTLVQYGYYWPHIRYMG
jgi:hypothetical protein